MVAVMKIFLSKQIMLPLTTPGQIVGPLGRPPAKRSWPTMRRMRLFKISFSMASSALTVSSAGPARRPDPPAGF
jgi:hypothetical protein